MLFQLAFKSLRNRIFATTLTVISIALSVALLFSVERAKRAAEEGFTQTISKTDLIVGARSGPLQLILYTVFNMGNATHNLSYEAYQDIKKHPSIAWTIPYSLGDAHRGFRVVGTTNSFFENYHYRGGSRVEIQKGRAFRGLWDVVLGSAVAAELKYKLGSKVVITHGVTKGEGVQHHDDKPFEVVGIMEATGTPLDRAVYVTLEGMEALHIDWQSGAAPLPGNAISASALTKDSIKMHSITAFFVGAKSRVETLRLQRFINDYSAEPLLAIIPGVTLNELWSGLSYVEGVLRMISWMVVVVGFMAMLIALTTMLNERRREMAILRSIGANTGQIISLLVFESGVLTLFGIVLGVSLSTSFVAFLGPWLEKTFGLYLAGGAFTSVEWLYILITFLGGLLIGTIPAYRAMRLSLKDGLSVKI